jgi:phage shock protein PspC (stress-responsive transcriptional regulator)
MAGTALMLPVLVGIPGLLGYFRTEPITDFAGVASAFGIEPTLALGVVLFGFGGTVPLPLVFLVIGSYLPPETPRALRGVTFATCLWVGFVTAFWPGGGAVTGALFIVFSLLGHWTYGLTLGTVLDRTTGIPQHGV